jgi:hypothetical protein
MIGFVELRHRQNEQRSVRIFDEPSNQHLLLAEQIADHSSRYIADPQPQDSWRRSEDQTPLEEIRVLRDKQEIVFRRVIPDGGVSGTAKTDITYVHRARIDVTRRRKQTIREILVQE